MDARAATNYPPASSSPKTQKHSHLLPGVTRPVVIVTIFGCSEASLSIFIFTQCVKSERLQSAHNYRSPLVQRADISQSESVRPNQHGNTDNKNKSSSQVQTIKQKIISAEMSCPPIKLSLHCKRDLSLTGPLPFLHDD